MNEEIAQIEQEPFKKGKCEACGSKAWANAKLSPRTFTPTECDRCPPKMKDTQNPKGSQEVQ